MDLLVVVQLNIMMVIGPLIVLVITISGLTWLYVSLLSWLPKNIFKILFGAIVLAGIYIWAIPFEFGFFDYYKNWGS